MHIYRSIRSLIYLLNRFLTVAEQMVTYYQSTDMTDKLNQDTYWASYNNVYFPDFRVLSHEEDQVATKGPQLYSWANSSRANIFRRDHHNVTNLDSMVYMMRLVQNSSIYLEEFLIFD